VAINRTHLIKPLIGSDLPTISHGKGIYLYDSEGNRYMDGASGAVTVNIGHGVKEVVNAMLDQANQVSFVYRSQFTSIPAEKLAEKLATLAPGDLNNVFFVNSGSEATETALKIALQYWQEQGKPEKNRILSRKTSYHGITIGALSMSGHAARRYRFEQLLADYPTVSPPYCYRCPFSDTYPGCALKCAAELETVILNIGPDNIAAFIIEPVIGAAGGAIAPPDGYHQMIRKICDKYDILLIADEIMTGCGRTGRMFAVDYWGIVPDIIALGKGLSSGYTPLAATLISDRILEVIENGSRVIMSGHTFSANPQSAAVCLAVMEYMENNRLIENAEYQGQVLADGLKQLALRNSIVGDIRGIGLLQGIEFVANNNTRDPFQFHTKVTERIVSKCFENGLIVYPAIGTIDGFSGDSILVAPPLVITSEEIQTLLTILEDAISNVSMDLYKEGLLSDRSIS
jgi:adenosylmethionine-8-amino-7-oxononanoate aminotransferase